MIIINTIIIIVIIMITMIKRMIKIVSGKKYTKKLIVKYQHQNLEFPRKLVHPPPIESLPKPPPPHTHTITNDHGFLHHEFFEKPTGGGLLRLWYSD